MDGGGHGLTCCAAMSQPRSSAASLRYLPEILVVAVVLAYGFFFGFRWNAAEQVVVHWWGGTAGADVPLFRVIVASFLAGLTVMGLLASVGRIERLVEIRRLRRRVRELQEDTARLRNVPEEPRAHAGRR